MWLIFSSTRCKKFKLNFFDFLPNSSFLDKQQKSSITSWTYVSCWTITSSTRTSTHISGVLVDISDRNFSHISRKCFSRHKFQKTKTSISGLRHRRCFSVRKDNITHLNISLKFLTSQFTEIKFTTEIEPNLLEFTISKALRSLSFNNRKPTTTVTSPQILINRFTQPFAVWSMTP